ncbi:unknown [Sinorhizobium phage PBC5]|nr:unknown [Sinorhizobium phage PBC5]
MPRAIKRTDYGNEPISRGRERFALVANAAAGISNRPWAAIVLAERRHCAGVIGPTLNTIVPAGLIVLTVLVETYRARVGNAECAACHVPGAGDRLRATSPFRNSKHVLVRRIAVSWSRVRNSASARQEASTRHRIGGVVPFFHLELARVRFRSPRQIGVSNGKGTIASRACRNDRAGSLAVGRDAILRLLIVIARRRARICNSKAIRRATRTGNRWRGIIPSDDAVDVVEAWALSHARIGNGERALAG